MDEQDVAYLDEKWMRHHVMGVSQGDCVILDGKSVHDNVAAVFGLPERVTREQVVDACRKALLHEFINGLADGYDTILGGSEGTMEDGEEKKVNGVTLSGGQRQRLAIARACIRNPTVLILDEATSALDPTSRLLVFEALKAIRRNKTTIVITHDLSQIEESDFVYVMRNGEVVEQGFRRDLEAGSSTEGSYSSTTSINAVGDYVFKEMLRSQMGMGGSLPTRDIDAPSTNNNDPFTTSDEKRKTTFEEEYMSLEETDLPAPPPTAASRLRPLTLTLGNWMFDVVADLTKTANGPGGALSRLSMIPEQHESQNQRASIRASRFIPSDNNNFPPLPKGEMTQVRKSRPTSIAIPSSPTTPTVAYTIPPTRRLSLQFTPTSPVFSLGDGLYSYSNADFGDNVSAMGSEVGLLGSRRNRGYGDDEEKVMEQRGTTAEESRRRRARNERKRWDTEKVVVVPTDKKKRFQVRVDKWKKHAEKVQKEDEAAASPLGFWQLLWAIYPTVPYKPLLFVGLVICVCSGAMTPIFSYLLSQLMFEVSIGASNVRIINSFGGLVLGIAALDGFLLGFKYFLMETIASSWVMRIRNIAYEKLLAQDKKFFDKANNISPRFVQILVKDGDDARNLIAVVIGQCLVVTAMLGVGLIWALARGWQLTLVGFAIAPVFAITMAVQTRLVTKCEVRNKRAREDVARGYYSVISNIRGIRTMSLDGLYKREFDAATERALTTGVRGAFVEGCTYGVSSGLIYLAEALLFYVGAVLIASGTYSYLQMVQTLNLVVFSVTIGSQLMAFSVLRLSGKSLTDITPAAGWVILDCDPHSTEQEIRLVCSSANHEDVGCNHVFSDGGAEHKVVRLPESCTEAPFLRIASARVAEDQSIPGHVADTLIKRDGIPPVVHILHVDGNWASSDVSKVGVVNFEFIGSNSPHTDAEKSGSNSGASQSRSVTYEKRESDGFFEWAGHVYDAVKEAVVPAYNTVKGMLVSSYKKFITTMRDLTSFDSNPEFIKSVKLDTGGEMVTIFHLEKEAVKCNVGTTSTLDVSAGGKIDAQVKFGLMANGSIIPPQIGSYAVYAVVNGQVNANVSVDATVTGNLASKRIRVAEVAITPLQIPKIIALGPSIRLEAQAELDLSLEVLINTNLKYAIHDLEFWYPKKMTEAEPDAKSGFKSLDFQPSPLSIDATVDIEAQANITAHLIPSLRLGLSALNGEVDGSGFIEVDAWAKLALQGKASIQAANHKRRQLYPPGITRPSYSDFLIPFSAVPATDTGSVATQFSGCLSVLAGAAVRAGASGKLGSLEGDTPRWEIYQSPEVSIYSCGTGKRKSLPKTQTSSKS
ncbi:hypothetical protein ONZ45_g12592 [Pleurotus djamor]|nr:hypothetical protein ONZ45_g12592 [Pleurotus djamor]